MSYRWIAGGVLACTIALIGCAGSGSSIAWPTLAPLPAGAAPPATVPPVSRPTELPPATFPPIELPPATFPPIDLPPATMPPTLPPGEPPVPGGGSALQLTPQVVTDPAANNLPALTFLLPQGWQAEGSVIWMHQWSRLAHLQTRIVDPATGIQIEWLPLQDFMYFQPPAGLEVPIGANYQGKAFVPPVTDPAQFVSDFWMPGPLAHLQGARLASVNQVPVVAQEFQRQFGGSSEAFAYRLRYEYAVDGQPWEEDVFLALLYAGSPEIVSWYVNFAYATRAPAGVLDREQAIISTVVASRVTTPEWEGTYRLVQRLFTQGIAQQMADTVAFGQALAQYRAESQALQQQVVAERQASQDRIAELRRDSLGGVQNYVNPYTQQVVQLPVGWNTYWVNAEGEYLVTDLAGFDPNTVGSTWQRVEPRDP